MELMIVIAIIGVISIMVSNFDFNKKTDIEKRDHFITKISSLIQTNTIAMTSGK
jgi:hypothetical protein